MQESSVHLAHTFVDFSVLRHCAQLTGRQLKNSNISVPRGDLCLDDINLLLCKHSTCLNFLNELDYSKQLSASLLNQRNGAADLL